jgi:alkanesulfonate monooxygenase SsuD/methylene tetrahydromethanopterin reductase-like flavin-dependent oxidoreductase (luciferase family)
MIERNHLECRSEPSSLARAAEAAGYQVAWIIWRDEGYSSRRAAASRPVQGHSLDPPLEFG